MSTRRSGTALALARSEVGRVSRGSTWERRLPRPICSGTDMWGNESISCLPAVPTRRSVAAVAPRQSGVEYEPLRPLPRRTETGASRRSKRAASGKGMSPSWYTVHGRADAFAVALGAKRIQPEHLLLALLWQPSGFHVRLLEEVGATRRSVYRALLKLGVEVPKAAPPREDDTRWGEFVTVRVVRGQAWELAASVRKQLPEGAPIGFNFNATHAWFHTGRGHRSSASVRKARRQQLAARRRSNAPAD